VIREITSVSARGRGCTPSATHPYIRWSMVSLSRGVIDWAQPGAFLRGDCRTRWTRVLHRRARRSACAIWRAEDFRTGRAFVEWFSSRERRAVSDCVHGWNVDRTESSVILMTHSMFRATSAKLLDADASTNRALDRHHARRMESATRIRQFSFGSEAFTGRLIALEWRFSMDGSRRFLDNIFIERLWRRSNMKKYISKPMPMPRGAAGIGSWMTFYNEERPHQAMISNADGRVARAWKIEALARTVDMPLRLDNAKRVAHIPQRRSIRQRQLDFEGQEQAVTPLFQRSVVPRMGPLSNRHCLRRLWIRDAALDRHAARRRNPLGKANPLSGFHR